MGRPRKAAAMRTRMSGPAAPSTSGLMTPAAALRSRPRGRPAGGQQLDERSEAEKEAQDEGRGPRPDPGLLLSDRRDEAHAHDQESGRHDQHDGPLGQEADPVGRAERGPRERQGAHPEGERQGRGQERRDRLGEALQALGQEHAGGQGEVLLLPRRDRPGEERGRQNQVFDVGPRIPDPGIEHLAGEGLGEQHGREGEDGRNGETVLDGADGAAEPTGHGPFGTPGGGP